MGTLVTMGNHKFTVVPEGIYHSKHLLKDNVKFF